MSELFDNAVVEPFFPTPVWIHDVQAARASRLNAKAIKDLETLTQPRPELTPGQNWQTAHDLHSYPEFAELVEIFDAATSEALVFLAVEHDGFEITGCWANLSPPGRSHRTHSHANNFLSGVYYVQTAPGADTITFHDPRPQIEQIAPPIGERNAYNSNAYHVPVRAGQLVMFPSWLAHSVPENTSDRLRISVSFNAMFTSFSTTMSRPRWTGIALRRQS